MSDVAGKDYYELSYEEKDLVRKQLREFFKDKYDQFYRKVGS